MVHFGLIYGVEMHFGLIYGALWLNLWCRGALWLNLWCGRYLWCRRFLFASAYNIAAARSSGSQFVTLKLGSSFPYLLHVSSVPYEVP